MSAPILRVDLGALVHNWTRLSALAHPAQLAAVVKADAYGLGIGGVAPTLARLGARQFFVAHVSEAMALRRTLPDPSIEIYTLNGLDVAHLAEMLAFDIAPVLNSTQDVIIWRQAASARTLMPKAALQLDTGMNRLGLKPADFNDLPPFDDLNIPWVISHLAVGDDPLHPTNARQIEIFTQLCAHVPHARKSLLNSAGLTHLDGPRFDLVRPGIALFGGMISPELTLKTVAQLSGRILALRAVATGDSVGYAAQFQARRPTMIATIGLGYADGYPRQLGDRARMWIVEAQAYAPVVGRVSMDLITLDVTDIDPGRIGVGYEVEAFGENITVEELAAQAGTISYEILTRVSSRVSRSYIGL